jgi:epoxide hydrolase-like predicted phosphatase
MAALCRLPIDAFGREYFARRLELDHGSIDGTAYWSRILTLGGVRPTGEKIRTLLTLDIGSWFHMNPRMMGWVEELRAAGLRTAILSNMPADCVEFLNREAAWMADFEVRVFSADVSMTKPEEAIYRHCLKLLGLEPAQALFLDDLPRNVEAARRIGIRTIRFQSPEQAAQEAAPLGLPVLSLS